MTNNNSVGYLEEMIPKFKQAIDDAIAAGERPPQRVRTLWMECQKRKMQIENACGQGAMTIEEYT